jgi:hypothetical protein
METADSVGSFLFVSSFVFVSFSVFVRASPERKEQHETIKEGQIPKNINLASGDARALLGIVEKLKRDLLKQITQRRDAQTDYTCSL